MFDTTYLPYASTRFPVVAANGMVCTGSSLAASAGLQILRDGGNAIDAAIATAACLTVVEPTANGIGSDAFAIVWHNNQLHGLNASGYAPASISIDAVKAKHPEALVMPSHGWTPVMVPGTPKGWAVLSQTFGKLPLTKVLQPAIEYARGGFPITPNVGIMWERAYRKYQDMFGSDAQFQAWFETFGVNGRAPKGQEIMYLPALADALERIAQTNSVDFYLGELAKSMVDASNRFGGFLSMQDLAEYQVSFVEPMKMHYRGYDICEIPPNGQGIVALMALNILKHTDIMSTPCLNNYHRQFEAMKLAFADGIHDITDPHQMTLNPKKWLSSAYGLQRAKQIREYAQLPRVMEPTGSDTVYLCTADKEGNMVSYIQSNYMGFGSGIVVNGVSLQNRGHTFSLDAAHANALAPRKKTYHTIIPGFIMQNERAIGSFGIMGGYMQPQAHVQVAMNLIDYHMNPQAALDAPRWQWIKDNRFIVEPSFDTAIAKALVAKGHQIDVSLDVSPFGRGQMIVQQTSGVYVGGCDSRTDSSCASY